MTLSPDRIEAKAQDAVKRASTFVTVERVVLDGLLKIIAGQRAELQAMKDENARMSCHQRYKVLDV